MAGIIFDNYSTYGYNFISHPKTFIVVNKLYKDVGIESINFSYNDNSFHSVESVFAKKITIFVKPHFSNIRDNEEDIQLCDFYNKCPDFNDSVNMKFYYRRGFISGEEDAFPIKIKKIVIGYYLSKQNVIILVINPFIGVWNDNNIKHKDYLKIHKDITNAIKKLPIKKVDIEDYEKKMFIRNVKNDIDKDIERSERLIRDYRRYIKDNERSLVEKYAFIEKTLKMIELLNEQKQLSRENLYDKLQEVKKLKFLKELRIENNKIIFNVGKITLEGKHNGDNYKVYAGEYEIHLQGKDVKIYNLDTMKYSDGDKVYPHPHISHYGECCFGTSEQSIIISNLIAQNEYKKLVLRLYAFLKTYSQKGGPYIPLHEYLEEREDEGKFDVEGNRIKK